MPYLAALIPRVFGMRHIKGGSRRVCNRRFSETLFWDEFRRPLKNTPSY